MSSVSKVLWLGVDYGRDLVALGFCWEGRTWANSHEDFICHAINIGVLNNICSANLCVSFKKELDRNKGYLHSLGSIPISIRYLEA